MVEKFAEGLEEEDDIGSQENFKCSNNRVDDMVRSAKEEFVIPRQVGEAVVTLPDQVPDHPAGSNDRVSGIRVFPILPRVQG
ncbi:hypothetical protein A2U01_0091763, partial [Trifolium medium]|nr:hypothetical protein [Trifolium medium]